MPVEAIVQVIEGLAAAALAFLFGLMWQRIKNAFLNYRARRFWGPLMSEDLQLVIGRFRGLQQFEASGMIGAGDALAMNDLHQYFKRIGYDGFRVSYNDQLGYGDATGDALRTNLILLGGPDANTLTHELIGRLNLGIAFKELDARSPGELLEPRVFRFPELEPERGFSMTRVAHNLRQLARNSDLQQWRTPVFVDLLDEDKIYEPAKDGSQIIEDCGLIVRVPNPFDSSKSVVIICGSYGYGSWAAVQLLQTKEFVNRIPKGTKTLECVFSVEVVRDVPQRPQVLVFRAS
jgi:hypothetical protein